MYTTLQSSQRQNITAPIVCLLLLGVIFIGAATASVVSFIAIRLSIKSIDSGSRVNGDSKDARQKFSSNYFKDDVVIEDVDEAVNQIPKQRKRRSDDTEYSESDDEVTGNIPLISLYWGNLRPYQDNPSNYFGISDTGLPSRCQVEQTFVLHRHGARYPGAGDMIDINNVTSKLHNTNGVYTGPLSFLNSWSNQLGFDSLLPDGARMEYQSGVDFWRRYGRILYNATQGQYAYNSTGQTKPSLRCNTVQRITDSAVAWANGFFGLYNATDKYDLLKIPALPNVNNTLASYYSCRNFLNTTYNPFDINHALYYPVNNYLKSAVVRLSQYVPSDVSLTTFDVFIMQELCAFEYSVFAASDFCSLFTVNEWKGFRYTFDLYLYNGYSFGSSFGRALGLGTLQELLARLQKQTITVSNSSVNTTFDGNTTTFPLGQKFYMDMTHDFMLISLLTAMSIDYFRQNLQYDDYPPPEGRHFKSTNIVPYAARIVVEKIGCSAANPTASSSRANQYTATQYRYSPSDAQYKFIRMRLNHAIVPLNTIRGGFCSGRTDGLCPFDQFIKSQANATALANYQRICFTNYVYNASRFYGDGNYFP